MRNYYIEIHRYLERLINNIIVLDKKGFRTNGETLSITDVLILKIIGEQSEKKMAEIMEELNLDRNTFGTIINRLQLQNYIIKSKSEEDKRAYTLRLSEKGIDTFGQLQTKEKEMLFTLLNDFTFNEEKAILKFLVKLDMLNRPKYKRD